MRLGLRQLGALLRPTPGVEITNLTGLGALLERAGLDDVATRMLYYEIDADMQARVVTDQHERRVTGKRKVGIEAGEADFKVDKPDDQLQSPPPPSAAPSATDTPPLPAPSSDGPQQA